METPLSESILTFGILCYILAHYIIAKDDPKKTEELRQEWASAAEALSAQLEKTGVKSEDVDVNKWFEEIMDFTRERLNTPVLLMSADVSYPFYKGVRCCVPRYLEYGIIENFIKKCTPKS